MAENADGGGRTAGLILGALAVVVVLGAACLGAVAVVGILAAIAIPNFVAMQLKAKRAEVPANVDGIRVAELAYEAAYDHALPVGDAAEAARQVPGREPRPFEGGEAWTEIGWQPDGLVRGTYWVVLTTDGFEVHGLCDVDDDGELAEFVADQDTRARMVTPPGVY